MSESEPLRTEDARILEMRTLSLVTSIDVVHYGKRRADHFLVD